MEEIKHKIKEMLVRRLKLKMDPSDIEDDAELFAPDGLGLDSIDALELVVGLQKEFGLAITDKAVAEKILVSVNSMANFLKGNGSAEG